MSADPPSLRRASTDDRSQVAKEPQAQANLKRRGFLLSLGIGGAGAATLAVRSMSGAKAVTEVAIESDASGYQVTEHVRNYYRTTKV
jgi:hypothetical protein